MSELIIKNKKARHDFQLQEHMEAGLMLKGWEVKSLRAGKIQLQDSYVIVKKGEIWLLGAIIQPLNTASTHEVCEPTRTRKLLLKRKEISTLIGKVERKGFTLVPLSLYWKDNKVKIEIALAKGKQTHDKRASLKEREWQRQKARTMKLNR